MFLFVVCVKSVRYLCFFLTLDMLASNYNFPLTMTSSRITDNNIYFLSHVASINYKVILLVSNTFYNCVVSHNGMLSFC